jgi:hypothetical protein
MTVRKIALLFLTLSLLNINQANALPTFVGKYGGFTSDKVTGFLGTYTKRGFLKDIQIAALNSACVVNIPDQGESTSDRDTTITKSETPLIRVRSNGNFNATFDLIDESRVDFKDATVIIQGRLRGGKGRVNITISHSKSYEDGSTETCSGAAVINLKRGQK